MPKALENPSYKLTFDDAVQIHMRIWDGELHSRIAAAYDVNGGRISEINTGKLYPESRMAAERLYGRARRA